MFFYITVVSTITLTGVVLATLFHRYNRHCRPLNYQCPVRLDGKTILITGANSGIGKETAIGLVSLGAKVIMGCRNMERAEAAAEEIRQKTGVDPSLVSIVQLDVSDLDSVRNCSRKIYASEPRLDVLINNAGVGIGHVKTSKQGYEYTFTANHVGPFLLTHLLLGMLKKSSPSRIINVSSVGHYGAGKTLDFSRESKLEPDMKYPGLSTYGISKLAQIFHSNVLAEKLKDHSVVANSVHPGYVRSAIWKPNSHRIFINWLLRAFGYVSMLIGRSSKDGAQNVIYMAADPALEKVSGQYFENMAISDQLSTLAKDPELAKKMWDVSMEMCGLTKKVE